MQLLFDGYWWQLGPLANRMVQRELITAWLHEYPFDEVTVALRHADSRSVTDLPSVRVVTTRLWPHGLSNIFELGRIARSVQADVIIAHNYTPLSGTCATFIHDVMFRDHPRWFSAKERVYFWPMIPSARRATHTFTSTRTEAHRIERLAPELAPVHPIGLGVSSALAQATPQRPREVDESMAFALCVGRLNVRKNLAGTMAAAVSSRSVSPSTPLIVVGSSEYSGVAAETMPEEFQRAARAGTVRFLGAVSDPELAWLYAHASLTVYLSLDEGFGLPPLEAVYFSSPLVTSDIPVLRETVGTYATLINPSGPREAIAHAIDATWSVPGTASARDEILKRFTWGSAVRELRSALESSPTELSDN